MTDDLPINAMPGSLRRIAEHCGNDIAMQLWANYGGGHVHVPANENNDHPLAQLLGKHAMAALLFHFSGETLMIPKAHAAQIMIRNRAIRAGRANGLTQHALARQYNLTERQVWAICNDRTQAQQEDLFA